MRLPRYETDADYMLRQARMQAVLYGVADSPGERGVPDLRPVDIRSRAARAIDRLHFAPALRVTV